MSTVCVGIDLAWGDRAPSGVCVTEGGAVIDSVTVTSDDEIVELVPAHAAVVAFDAPIVVRNRAGWRDCDRQVNRCFRRFHAGVYPANRSRPWFVAPRAARLADRLGLTVDGRAGSGHAIEVHPHAAAVALFDLERILPYKPRPGRDAQLRRAALRQLAGHLEGLRDADPPLDVAAGPRWSALISAIGGPGSRVARIEDELDAHLCAYVALRFAADPHSCDVVGRFDEGAIVIPASPRTSPCLAGRP